ncbi:ribonuclease BN [Legionella birminghamensis]|uniref:Ribonuclease BN n=1 Tax=Legionella birminghamensis TaxID=28083 RepID=A0A378I6E4_9GAMM|nr:YihY/virulence factor BrkB family protein [Legionella birminghamensis]KTC73736.1 ribonuclease BN [Legionella birminghamensis]STX30767.1 ribonuclease BN [Legionella birminghamensis]
MDFKRVFKHLLENWSADKVATLSAGLSYYTIFSLAPLLIISIAIAGLVFDPDSVRQNLLQQFAKTFGTAPAEQIKMMISSVKPSMHLFAKIVSIIILLFGASGFFGALQTGLNTVWGVTPKSDRGFWGIIADRFLSFTLVLGVGFLLLVSLIISLILSIISSRLLQLLPQFAFLGYGLNFVISITGITLLFAMIFKIIPDVLLRWKDVWLGAFITALLFTLGKFLLGLYLSHSNLAEGFGASGALIIILVWIYYSAQILFTGAEFTKVYYLEKNKKIQPGRHARLVK